MSRGHHRGSKLVVGMALLALAGCASPEPAPEMAPEPQTIAGSCESVFGGDVCTWGTMTDGQVTEFGATVQMAAIEGTPMEGPMVFPPVTEANVALPADIAAATGFDHLGVNWELHGHPPALFMTPHFDFHFYRSSPEQVAAIDCTNLEKPAAPPAAYTLPDIDIPDMGTLVGLCVPGMGMHAMPEAELELTDPFDASMIVGYYGGELTFIEPMIARAKLMEAASFDVAVPPAPPGTPASVRWPTSFQATYDTDSRSYRFTFSLGSR